MPIREYKCSSCGEQFEWFEYRDGDVPLSCQKCGSAEINAEISAASFQCNSPGCYTYDYGGKRGK